MFSNEVKPNRYFRLPLTHFNEFLRILKNC